MHGRIRFPGVIALFPILSLLIVLSISPTIYCEDQAAVLLQRATAARKQGNLEESKRLLEQALAESPRNVDLLEQYAIVLSHMKLYDESLERFREALELSPDHAGVKIGIARVKGWKGDYDAAIADYEDVLRDHPEAVEAYLGLGHVWSWKGDTDRATEYAELYVSHVPLDPDGYLLLGRLYRRKGDFEKSREYYQKALDLEPANEEALKGIEKPQGPPRFRFDTGYSYTGINRRSDWNHQFGQLSYEPNKITTLIGRVDRLERFDSTDVIYSGEIYHDLTEKLNAHLVFGGTPNSDFSPKTLILTELSISLPYASSLVLGYSRRNFPDGDVDTLTAELYHYVRDDFYVAAKYYRTFHFSGEETNSCLLRANYDVAERIIVRGGVAYGAEASDPVSTGEADTIDISSFFGGVVFRLSERQGIGLDYAFEDRDTGFEHHTFGIGYYVKF